MTSYRGPHGGQTTNVPADAFFAFNSARLLPGADIILGPIATKAREPAPGGNNHRICLARRRLGQPTTSRCQLSGPGRSGRRLISLGVPAGLIGKAVGRGTAGQPRSACYRDGHLDEAVCARLRRVLITLRSARAVTS